MADVSPKAVHLSLFSSPESPVPPVKETSHDRTHDTTSGNSKKSSPRKNSAKTTAKNEMYQLSLLRFLSDPNTGSLGNQQPGRPAAVGNEPGTVISAPAGTGDGGTASFASASEPAISEQRNEFDGDLAERGRGDEFVETPRTNIEADSPEVDPEAAVEEPADTLLIELSPQTSNFFTTDYRITAQDELGKGGATQKIQDNFRAIQNLKNPEDLPPEELQRIFVKYVGWGGLPQVFDPDNANYESLRSELAGLLDEKEFAAARRSTQDAHFTSETVVRAMWGAVGRLGLYGEIRALEPAMGTGNFIGLAPEQFDLAWHGVELDPTTASLAKNLYPEETILNMSFTAFPSNASMFNLVIGNPPFGRQSLFDPSFDGPKGLSIHNYFIAKSISLLEPGGIAAFVVSRFFLDAQDSTTREFIASQADFLGAVRLPNTAFQENALTTVTTDIVFFQKNTGEKLYPTDWTETVNEVTYRTDPNGYRREEIPYTLNRWYFQNENAMIGNMEVTHGAFQNTVGCVLYNQSLTPLENLLDERLQQVLPKGQIYKKLDYEENKERIEQNLELVQSNYFKTLKASSFAIEPVSGAIIAKCSVDPNLAKAFFSSSEKTNFHLNWYTEVPCKPAQRARIHAYITLRDTLRSLFEAEKDNNQENMTRYRAELNTHYDTFIKEFGFLNASTNHSLFRDDPESSLVEALEKNYSKGISVDAAKKKGIKPYPSSAEKADIFTQQVLFPDLVPSTDMSSVDALFYCLHKYGRILPVVIAEVKGTSEETVMKELLQTERVFKNPASGFFETKEKYLSGDVKKKLQQAKDADAEKGENIYAQNIKALEAVVPTDISPVDIGVHFGASWIPPDIVRSFICETIYEEKNEGSVHLTYSPLLAQSAWTFKCFYYDDMANTVVWGTSNYPASNLIPALLNSRPIKVEYEDENGSKILDYDETTLANQKAEKIKQAFADWIWKDDERRERLTRIYNDKFNCHVPPQYDGSHFELVNANEVVTLRPHQKNAVWRGIQEGGGLFDHVVGAGKTMVAIATIMESRRMGLCSKPMVVVPNSLLYQWRNEFLKLYPNANILVAEKTDFTKDNRERLFSRIATGSWDAIIIGHSSFGRIEMPLNEQHMIIEEEVKSFEAAIVEQRKEDGKYREVKKLEKKKEALENTLKEISAKMNRTDRAMNFSDMGIDRLFVDESQEFKNLFFNTGQRVLGLGSPAGSAKAFDLFIKCRYLQRMNGNDSGVYFMTGTTISNTVAEMYTLQRYLQYNALQEKEIRTFDEWAKIFGKVVTGWELDASGVGYKLVSRFSQFQNVPELQKMYRSFADVITKKDIDLQQQQQGLPALTPPVKTGKPEGIIAERSSVQEHFMDDIIQRFAHMPSDPKEDNPLKATNDARKAGLDFRLIEPEDDDNPTSKINMAVENIFTIWNETKAERGTQLVFCDLSTPKAASSKYISVTPVDSEKELNISEDAAFREALETLEKESEDNDTRQEDTSISNEAGEDDDLTVTAPTRFFSVYEDVRNKLVEKGVPLEDIAFIHDAETDVQKARLFASMQTGLIRVLIGSTFKMGSGVNVQRRLVAAHHLDMPWRPSDLEQRDGRIIRQGNKFFEDHPDTFQVQIYRYLTKQMYDARMCQTLETKANAIAQFRAGDMTQREIKDVRAEAASLAEMKAAASGNPLIFLEVELSTELQRLESLAKQHNRTIYALKAQIRKVETYPDVIAGIESKRDAAYKRLKENTRKITNEKGQVEILHSLSFDGKIYTEENKNAIANRLNAVIEAQKGTKSLFFAEYRGFQINVSNQFYKNDFGYHFSLSMNGVDFYSPANLSYLFSEKFSLAGFFTRVDNWIERDFVNIFDRDIKNYAAEYATLDKMIMESKLPFEDEEQLILTRFNHASLLARLTAMQNSPEGMIKLDWTPAQSLAEMENQSITIANKEEVPEEKNKRIKKELLYTENPNSASTLVMLVPESEKVKFPEYDQATSDFFYYLPAGYAKYKFENNERIRLEKNSNGQETTLVLLSFEDVEKVKDRMNCDLREVIFVPEKEIGKICFLLGNDYEQRKLKVSIQREGIEEYEKEMAEKFPRTYSYKDFSSLMRMMENGEKTEYDILVEKIQKESNPLIKKGLSS